jgi:hypothetical protein
MSPRVRIVAIATLLVVFFGFGAGWLIARATSTTSSDSSLSTGRSPSGGASSTTKPGTSTPGTPSPGSTWSKAPSSTSTPSATGTTRSGNPPKPVRSVDIAGPRLDGSEEKNGCGRLLLHQDEPSVGLPVHIDGITLAISPSTAQAIHDDEAGCGSLSDPDAPLCVDAVFGPGGAASCLVGVRLEPDPAPNPQYSVGVGLRLRVHCTSPIPYPCNTIFDPVPTASEPVEATWTSTGPELVLAGNPDPQDEDEGTPTEDEGTPTEDEGTPTEDEGTPTEDSEGQPPLDEADAGLVASQSLP